MRWDGVIIAITRLPIGRNVLTKKGIFSLDRRDGTEDLNLNSTHHYRRNVDWAIQSPTFSSRISSAAKETGRSIVRILKT